MRLFADGIFSLLSMFLRDVGWPSVVGCFAAFLCAAVILQTVQGRRLTVRTVAYCAALSLYCTFVVAVTLLGRSPGLVSDASQHPLAMTYANEVEHLIDVAYNAMLFAPLGLLLAVRQGPLASMAIVVLATVAIEVVQLQTGRGLFEVSDIVGNVAGGVVGVCCALLVRRVLVRASST